MPSMVSGSRLNEDSFAPPSVGKYKPNDYQEWKMIRPANGIPSTWRMLYKCEFGFQMKIFSDFQNPHISPRITLSVGKELQTKNEKPVTLSCRARYVVAGQSICRPSPLPLREWNKNCALFSDRVPTGLKNCSITLKKEDVCHLSNTQIRL
jgi:hypothetical protein